MVEKLVMGIDEAGRGPVIGPLVICGLVVKEADQATLKSIGAKDSKLLTAKQREALLEAIKALAVSYKLITITPQEIDDALNDPNTNLNWLEADKAVELIDVLKPDHVFIDCPSTNIPAYTDYIRSRLKHNAVLQCAHHADRDYPVVSGASILAKLARDAELDKIKKTVGQDFGSGYPHDPITRAFLEKNWNKHPFIFRHSWATYKKIVDEFKGNQKKLGGY